MGSKVVKKNKKGKKNKRSENKKIIILSIVLVVVIVSVCALSFASSKLIGKNTNIYSEKIELNIGKNVNLSDYINDINTIKSYSVDKEGIISINNKYNITALQEGEVKLTVVYKDNKKEIFNIQCSIKSSKATVNGLSSTDQIHFISPIDATLITSQGKCGLIDMMYASAPEYKKGPNDTDWVKLSEEEVNIATKSPEANTEYAIKVNDEFVTIPQRPTSDGAVQNFSWKSGSLVAKYIKNFGCDKLDFIVMTHHHSDHIGGAKEIVAHNLVDSNTLVFYKKDVIATENGNIVDSEENKNYYNNAYFNDAFEAFSNKDAHMCDVSAGCSNLFGDYKFIKGFNQDKNPFAGYATNVDWTYYFDFGNFKINLYNLYHLANTAENMNSIVTLVTHKDSGKKAVIMGDQVTRVSEKLTYPNSSAAIDHPTGTCDECINKGIENQVADVIGKVELLRLGHHGHSGSNSYYMLNKFDASDVVISSGSSSSKTAKDQRTAMMKLVFEKRNPKANLTVTGDSEGAVVAIFDNNDIVMRNYNTDATDSDKDLKSGIFDSVPNGWYEMDNVNTTDNKIKIYVVDNTPVVGWKKIDSKWYYFNEDGIMQTGWQELEWNGKKNKYYFDNDGVMVSGKCIIIDESEYCFSSGGAYTEKGSNEQPSATEKIDEKIIEELNKCVSEQQEAKNSGKVTDDVSNIQCNTITETNKNNNVSRIHYLNLKGDAFVLESNGHFGLIDSSNPYNDDTPQAFSSKQNSIDHAIRYLDALGVKKFDFVIATHSHSDHIGGMVDIAKKYVDSTTKYYYREYIENANDYLYDGYSNSTDRDEGEDIVYNKSDDWYNHGYYCRSILSMNKCGAKLEEVTNKQVDLKLGEFKIKLLNTEEATDNEYVCIVEKKGVYTKDTKKNTKEKCDKAKGKYVINGENKNSIVQLVTYNDKKVLLAGDMEKEDEQNWIKNKLGTVDVLKLGNYGRTTSSSYEFMDYMKPESAVITTTYISNTTGNFESISYIQKKYGSNIYLTGNSDDAVVMDFKDSKYTFKNSSIDENTNSIVVNSNDELKINYLTKNDTDGLKKVMTNFEEKYVYLSGDKIVTNTKKKINNVKYKISSNGIIDNIGWHEDKNKVWYYYNKEGKALKGLQKISWRNKERWFYFNNSGKMQVGLQKIKNNKKKNWYYFNKSGIMQTGWQKINYNDKDSWFYFDDSGVMLTGLQELEWKGKTNFYYFDENGVMVTDKCITIDGEEYCFNSSGESTNKKGTSEIDKCVSEQQEAKKIGKVTDDVTSITCTNITEQNKNNGVTRIHYINLTSDAIVLESNGHFGLIDSSNPYNDGTPQSSTNKKNSVYRVKKYLEGLGVKKFDFVIATHSHSDHNGGMVEIAKQYVDSTTKFYYRKYVETANEYVDNGYEKDENGNVFYNKKEDWYNTGYYCRSILSMNKCGAKLIEVTNKTINLELGEFKIKIFNTEEAHDAEYRCVLGKNNIYARNYTYTTKEQCDKAGGKFLIAGENKNSIIQLVSYGDKKVLLTGDMEKEDELKLINNNLEAIDTLKLGHHGLKSATDEKFIDYVKPKDVVITNAHFSTKSTNFPAISYTQKKYGSNLYLAGNSDYAVVMDFKNSNYTFKNGTIDEDNNKVIVKSDSKIKSNFITKNDKDGFKKVMTIDGEKYVYLSGDTILTKSQKINNKKYIISSLGIIENIGWYSDEKGNWYYYNTDTEKQTGWKKINYKDKDSWFYFDKNGIMQTGWQKIKYNNKTSWFYFNSEGIMQTGWKKINYKDKDSWFYFDEKGVMQTGLQELEYKGKTNFYYFDENGIMVTDKCITIDSEEYCFNSSGESTNKKGTSEIDKCVSEQQEAKKIGKVTDDVSSITCTNITEQNKNNNATRIHYIRMKGDAIILESNGHFGLIDSGNPYNDGTPQEKSDKNNSVNRVVRYLDALGVKKFDFVIVTHAHSDHNGGMVDIAKKYVDSTTKYYYKEYANTLEEYVYDGYSNSPKKDESGKAIYSKIHDWYNKGYYCRSIISMNKCGAELIEVTNKKVNLELGEFKIKIFNTEPLLDDEKVCVIEKNGIYVKDTNYNSKTKCENAGGKYVANDENKNSIIQLVTYKNKKVLLTGDMEREDEYKLISNKLETVDVLKLGHHGSRTASSIDFMKQTQPKDTIITFENLYKNSNYEAISYIQKKYGSNIYLAGNSDDAIVMDFKDSNYSVKNGKIDENGNNIIINSNDKIKINFISKNDSDGLKKVMTVNGEKYVYLSGDKIITDTKKKIENKYIVSKTGIIQNIGWYQDEKGNWYYYNINAEAQTGWQKIKYKNKDSWFYFNKSGIMQTGLKKLEWNGKTNLYYFNSNGVMVSDKCIDIDGEEYCFDKSGASTGEKPQGNVNEELSKCVEEQQESLKSGKVTDDVTSIACNNITEQNKNNGVTRIHYIDVMGDAILLESNGHFGLIDSGDPYNDNTPQALSNKDNSINHILRYLDALGVKKFDFVIATHSHSDHIGGMVDIAKKYIDSTTKYYYRKYEITSNDIIQDGYSTSTKTDANGNILYDKSKDFYNKGYYCRSILSMNRCGAELIEVTNKKVNLELGKFKIKILNSEVLAEDEYICDVKGKDGKYTKQAKYNTKEKCDNVGGKYVAETENANSLIQLITYKDKKVLLTGDIRKKDEIRVTKSDLGEVDVLKLGHHGATTSSSYEFMDYTKPKDAVITFKNLYVSSTNFEAISYIQKKYGSNIYLTGKSDDAVVMDFESSKYTFKNGTIDEANNNVVINSNDNIKINYISKNDSDGLKKIMTDKGEKYVYLSGDKIVTNTKKKIDNKYIVASNGLIENIGWYSDEDGKWYYYNTNAEKQTGWKKINYNDKDSWFYFDKNGVMQTGWKKIKYNKKDSWFYFDKNGVMQTGWKKINYKDKDSWFYFNKNGVMQTGWQQLEYKGNTNWFYFGKNGVMESGKCTEISGFEYCFGESGEYISGNATKELNECVSEQKESKKFGKVTDDISSITCTNITEQNKNNGVTRIHYIHLSSDAIVLESNGHFGLIDSGNPYDDGTPQAVSNKNNSINRVIRYLDALGVKKFDFVIATHAHSDHVGGMVDIAKKYVDATTKYYYRKYVETANEYVDNGYVKDENGNVFYNKKEDWYNTGYYCRSILSMNKCGAKLIEVTNKTINLELGEFKIKIFNTEEAYDDEYRCVLGENNIYTRNYTNKTKAKCEKAGGKFLIAGENKNSIIQLVSYGDKKVLLTGDMEKEDEIRLINNNLEAINVLKLGHHGIKSATDERFLDYIKPKDVVITASNYYANITNFPAIAYTQKKYGSTLYLAGNSDDAVIMDFKSSDYSFKNGIIDDNNKVTVKSDSKIKSNFITKDDKDGFKKVITSDGEKYVYLSGDTILTKSQKINNKKYTISSVGIIENIGLSCDEKGKCYYYNTDGEKQTGWQKIAYKTKDYWYYFNKSGVMQTGWQKIKYKNKNSWFYFNNEGVMQIGWKKINYKGKDSWFYFDENGVMQTGLQQLEYKGKTSWYYFESTGVMVSDKCMDIKDENYCFDSSGVCTSGKNC